MRAGRAVLGARPHQAQAAVAAEPGRQRAGVGEGQVEVQGHLLVARERDRDAAVGRVTAGPLGGQAHRQAARGELVDAVGRRRADGGHGPSPRDAAQRQPPPAALDRVPQRVAHPAPAHVLAAHIR